MTLSWYDLILDTPNPVDAWTSIFDRMKDVALATSSPVALHDHTVTPDRLLSEAAWKLWESYEKSVSRTSVLLRQWCSAPSSSGRAVLILDALSLRELPLLVGGARQHGIELKDVRVMGSEVPSTTDQFAKALGISQRSALQNDTKPGTFTLFGNREVYTDVLSAPFEDCAVSSKSNLFIWHTWLDDLLHLQHKLPDQVASIASSILQGDGFWSFVNRLRQGRDLVITADHGYAVSKRFCTEETDPDAVETLRTAFGASRYKVVTAPWGLNFMPPVALQANGHHVVVGQRKWKVQGGFPHVCHGGLSLLEVAVPWVEISTQ